MEIRAIMEIIETNPPVHKILKYCPYEILKRWELREYPIGSVICQQGERYDRFHLIADGCVNFYYTAENGKRYSQEMQDTGGFFGEFEIFEQSPYICSVEAFTNVRLLQIEYPDFMNWLENDQNFSVYITKHLCAHFYHLASKAGEDALYSLKARVCKYLVSLSKLHSSEVKNLEIEFDKNAAGEWFGVAPRSIYRVLQNLKDQNLIQLKPKTIFIPDLQTLIDEGKNSRFE